MRILFKKNKAWVCLIIFLEVTGYKESDGFNVGWRSGNKPSYLEKN
jgi:hypothetical protein